MERSRAFAAEFSEEKRGRNTEKWTFVEVHREQMRQNRSKFVVNQQSEIPSRGAVLLLKTRIISRKTALLESTTAGSFS